MAKRTIFITVQDMRRLSRMLIEAAMGSAEDEHLRQLEQELDRSKLVRPEEVPPDVVTMNSRLRIRDLDSGEERVFTLVFPDEQARDPDSVSILSALGTAVLGFRVGGTVRLRATGRTLNLRVEELLYQPEAAGDMHL